MAVVERVVLWGFMASGKTAVASLLARRLGWDHVDLDAEIVRREGRSVAEIFRTRGEPAFRQMEADLTRELVGRSLMVFSPGGGWITQPELPRLLPPGTLTVWLRARPDTILERLRSDVDGPERPLLRTADPAAVIHRLLRDREPLYGQAEVVVDTDQRDLDSIVREIERFTRTAGAAGKFSQQDPNAQ